MPELVMEQTEASTEGTVVRARKARSTGQEIEFVKHKLHDYEVRCVHGSAVRGNKRYEVARKASSPEEWCAECQAVIEAKAEAANAPEPEPEEEDVEEPEEEINATEAAIQRAEDYGVNLDEVEGTGVDGRILVSDVMALADA